MKMNKHGVAFYVFKDRDTSKMRFHIFHKMSIKQNNESKTFVWTARRFCMTQRILLKREH